MHRAFSPMLFEALRAPEVLARGLVPFQRRSTVEFDSSPNGLGQVFVPGLRINLMTYPEYVACINHSEPILFTQFECRPGDMLHETVIAA